MTHDSIVRYPAGCGNGDDKSSPPVTAVKDAGAESGGDATATMPPHDAGASDVDVPEIGSGEAGLAAASFPIDEIGWNHDIHNVHRG